MHKPEFIKFISEASNGLDIDVVHFSDNWAIRLSKNNAIEYIIGYTFPLNNAATYKIARNKNLCSEVLTNNQIPNVPHSLFNNPEILLKRNLPDGNLQNLEIFASEHGFPLVVKRNESSHGNGVFIARNQSELEYVVQNIFLKDYTLCLSPFRDILNEYRCVILDNECILSYEKVRPFVTGDGTSSVVELQQSKLGFFKPTSTKRSSPVEGSLLTTPDYIPQKGEPVFLSWKHNATLGVDYHLVQDVSLNELAIKAATAINARFVSVDIIRSRDYSLEILEINATVVLNVFSSVSESHRQKALEVFRKALKKIFHKLNLE